MQPVGALLGMLDATELPLFGGTTWSGRETLCLAAFAPCTKYVNALNGTS
jgi:hypothetical protein